MNRFLADENFSGIVLKALRRERPDIDVLTIQQAGIEGISDPDVLEYAAMRRRLTLSRDVQTMIGHAERRVRVGKPMPGLIIIPQRPNVRRIVEDLILIAECIAPGEWEGLVKHLPL